MGSASQRIVVTVDQALYPVGRRAGTTLATLAMVEAIRGMDPQSQGAPGHLDTAGKIGVRRVVRHLLVEMRQRHQF